MYRKLGTIFAYPYQRRPALSGFFEAPFTNQKRDRLVNRSGFIRVLRVTFGGFWSMASLLLAYRPLRGRKSVDFSDGWMPGGKGVNGKPRI